MKKIALLCLLLAPFAHAGYISDEYTNISYRYSENTHGIEFNKFYHESGFLSFNYKLGGSFRHDTDNQQDYGFIHTLIGGDIWYRNNSPELFFGPAIGVDKVGEVAIGLRTDFLFRPFINEKRPLTAGITLDYSINSNGLDTGTLAFTMGWNIYPKSPW